MGRGYEALCKRCGQRAGVHDGPGMGAMPLRCDTCGKEWWWEFGPGGPIDKSPEPRACECGGTFTEEAPPRCRSCRSTDLERDPDGYEIMYD